LQIDGNLGIHAIRSVAKSTVGNAALIAAVVVGRTTREPLREVRELRLPPVSVLVMTILRNNRFRKVVGTVLLILTNRGGT
jgi:hypothetical protein